MEARMELNLRTPKSWLDLKPRVRWLTTQAPQDFLLTKSLKFSFYTGPTNYIVSLALSPGIELNVSKVALFFFFVQRYNMSYQQSICGRYKNEEHLTKIERIQSKEMSCLWKTDTDRCIFITIAIYRHPGPIKVTEINVNLGHYMIHANLHLIFPHSHCLLLYY